MMKRKVGFLTGIESKLREQSEISAPAQRQNHKHTRPAVGENLELFDRVRAPLALLRLRQKNLQDARRVCGGRRRRKNSSSQVCNWSRPIQYAALYCAVFSGSATTTGFRKQSGSMKASLEPRSIGAPNVLEELNETARLDNEESAGPDRSFSHWISFLLCGPNRLSMRLNPFEGVDCEPTAPRNLQEVGRINIAECGKAGTQLATPQFRTF